MVRAAVGVGVWAAGVSSAGVLAAGLSLSARASSGAVHQHIASSQAVLVALAQLAHGCCERSGRQQSDQKKYNESLHRLFVYTCCCCC